MDEIETEVIDYNTGKVFPRPLVFAGYVCLVTALYFMYNRIINPIESIGLLFIGGFASFTSAGVQIDIVNKKYREYSSYFGLERGQWKSFETYTDIAVLGTREIQTSYSLTNVEMTERQKYFDICLLDKTHRDKLKIKRFIDKEQAIQDAKDLSEKLGVQFTTYNPQISSTTRARRRR